MKRKPVSRKSSVRKPRIHRPSRLDLLTQSTAIGHIHLSTHEVERRRDLQQAHRNSVDAEVFRLASELAHAKALRAELDAVIGGLNLVASR